jgi:hypothetical protein
LERDHSLAPARLAIFRFNVKIMIEVTVSDVAAFSRGNHDPRGREDVENRGSSVLQIRFAIAPDAPL